MSTDEGHIAFMFKEVYITSNPVLLPNGVEHVIEKVKKEMADALAEILFDPEVPWFKCIVNRKYEKRLQTCFMNIIRDILAADCSNAFDPIVCDLKISAKNPRVQNWGIYDARTINPKDYNHVRFPEAFLEYPCLEYFRDMEKVEGLDLETLFHVNTRDGIWKELADLGERTGCMISCNMEMRLVYLAAHKDECIEAAVEEFRARVKAHIDAKTKDTPTEERPVTEPIEDLPDPVDDTVIATRSAVLDQKISDWVGQIEALSDVELENPLERPSSAAGLMESLPGDKPMKSVSEVNVEDRVIPNNIAEESSATHNFQDYGNNPWYDTSEHPTDTKTLVQPVPLSRGAKAADVNSGTDCTGTEVEQQSDIYQEIIEKNSNVDNVADVKRQSSGLTHIWVETSPNHAAPQNTSLSQGPRYAGSQNSHLDRQQKVDQYYTSSRATLSPQTHRSSQNTRPHSTRPQKPRLRDPSLEAQFRDAVAFLYGQPELAVAKEMADRKAMRNLGEQSQTSGHSNIDNEHHSIVQASPGLEKHSLGVQSDFKLSTTLLDTNDDLLGPLTVHGVNAARKPDFKYDQTLLDMPDDVIDLSTNKLAQDEASTICTDYYSDLIDLDFRPIKAESVASKNNNAPLMDMNMGAMMAAYSVMEFTE